MEEDPSDRTYYHGRITREEAVEALTRNGRDGYFLLRMSTSQEGVYTISVMQGSAVRHIRIINVRGGYVLSQGDPPENSVWDLIANQRNKTLTNTLNTRDAVALRHALKPVSVPIAPDLLNDAGEAGMDPTEFDDMAAAFLEGGLSAKEIVRRRSVKYQGGVSKEDLVRKAMGKAQAADPDLERFLNGKISAEELQARRQKDVEEGLAEFVEEPASATNPFAEQDEDEFDEEEMRAMEADFGGMTT